MLPLAATLGAVGLVALGGALYQRVGSLHHPGVSAGDTGTQFSVRYEPRERPDISVRVSPSAPTPGSTVELELAGLQTGRDGLFLHYTVNLERPDDRVVPLERALVHGSGFGILVWLPVLDWEP